MSDEDEQIKKMTSAVQVAQNNLTEAEKAVLAAFKAKQPAEQAHLEDTSSNAKAIAANAADKVFKAAKKKVKVLNTKLVAAERALKKAQQNKSGKAS